LDCEFFCLQKDIWDRDKKYFEDSKINYLGDNNFLEIAAIIENLDLVISTPHRYLYQIGKDAAALGINILIEKPIALNLSDAVKLVNYCNDKKVKMGVSFVHRYRKEVLKTKEWISKKGNLFTTIFFELKDNFPPFNEFALIISLVELVSGT